MSEAAVQLKLAGQTYQVVTSADEGQLRHLAKVVEDALYEVTPEGRQPSPQALVLAAITLAHELEEERKKRAALEEKYRSTLTTLLERVDQVLADTAEAVEEEEEPAQVKARSRGPGKTTPFDRSF